MKSNKDDAIDDLGKLNDDDIKKLYGDCDASVGPKVGAANDKRKAMIDAIADDYLDDNNELPIGEWIPMKLPKLKP